MRRRARVHVKSGTAAVATGASVTGLIKSSFDLK
jgi:hypothetical protein